jgi:hypothetical protein
MRTVPFLRTMRLMRVKKSGSSSRPASMWRCEEVKRSIVGYLSLALRAGHTKFVDLFHPEFEVSG